MRIYSSLFLMVLLILCACQAPPPRDCAQYKTGEFSSYIIFEGDTLRSRFQRENTLQIEQFEQKVDSYSLRWINDCEYVLKKINPKSRAEEKSNHVKILTTTDSSYTFEFNTIGESKKLKGVAIKY